MSEIDHTYSGYGAEDDGMSAYAEDWDDPMGDEQDTCECGMCDCNEPVYQFGDVCDACACEHIVL